MFKNYINSQTTPANELNERIRRELDIQISKAEEIEKDIQTIKETKLKLKVQLKELESSMSVKNGLKENKELWKRINSEEVVV